MNAHLAYKLLIDIPRENRRKDVIINEEIIERIANLLVSETIIPEQLDMVISLLSKNKQLAEEELINQLHIKEISNEELETIVKQKVDFVGKDKLKTVEDEQRYIPKIVALVLKECNYSIKGQTVVNLVNSIIKEAI